MQTSLASKLKENVDAWRSAGYPSDYPAISEILEYQLVEMEGDKTLRYLRKAQLEALETYWYLRLIEKTPHVFELYTKTFQKNELLESLGIKLSSDDLQEMLFSSTNPGIDGIIEKIKNDDAFAKKYRLEAVRETLTLAYPSYILALAMGSGKTVLIGSIVATEFAMSLEYPGGDFVKNALVFAPGKTILGALKELSNVPYEKILPPRFYKQFMSTVKITYTQDGEKNIPVTYQSVYNLIVTNTEKIRIQKSTNGKGIQTILNFKQKEKDEEREEIANLRLQTIASLPNLAIFSDEAHHTYGQSLDNELKKVRKTVDYLADKTNVIAVVNTTGTPYFKKQMLKDVVYWYGLSQGIKDGILKEVKDNIISFEDISSKEFLSHVVENFFQDYGKIKIFDGSPAKLAIYFPQTDDLAEAKPIVEKALLKIGYDSSIALEVTNESKDDVKDLFDNRINDPLVKYRVFLLVNKGTEGWNCPSLFATALARKLTSSNNFVLQAATRCLRQTPGNISKARIYLSKENVGVLDSQLRETFGESLVTIAGTPQDMRKARLIIRKTEIPPISVKKKMKRVVIKEETPKPISFAKPKITKIVATKTVWNAQANSASKKVLTVKDKTIIQFEEEEFDARYTATELSAIYRITFDSAYSALMQIYPDGDVPTHHLLDLKKQIEQQLKNYEIKEEEIEVALMLVRPEGFDKEMQDGKPVYTTEIIYHKDKENLLLKFEDLKTNKKGFSFHYSPYNFDSKPEKDFLIRLLEALNEDPDDVEDIFFTGAITDPAKTDFFIEYQDKHGKWRNYTPDFVIKKKNGKIVIVEIKAEQFYDEHKEMALKAWAKLNPDRLKYQFVYSEKDGIRFEDYQKVKSLIYAGVTDEKKRF